VHLYEPLEDILSLKNLSVLDCSQLGVLTEEVMKHNGLAHSDALNAACCKANGIKHMASSDGHFEKVDFLTVWQP
jgi:predicted nucleic acid-binding protein